MFTDRKSVNQYLQKTDYNYEIDLIDANRQSEYLSVDNKTKNIELLQEFKNLKFLSFTGAHNQNLSTISSYSNIETLQLRYFKDSDLIGLKRTSNVSTLLIDDSSKLNSLIGIQHLIQLALLSINNSKNITSLEEISKLNNLRYFDLAGGNLKNVKIDSLKPLKNIQSLLKINISVTKVLDERLDYLGNLASLKELSVPNNFPASEFALLSNKLKSTSCEQFKPFVDCGSLGLMITGKGKPFLKTKKQLEKLNKYIEEFQKLKNA